MASDDLEVRAGEIVAREEKVAVLAMRPPLHTQRHMTWINAGKKPDTYAHNLYNHLRTLDRDRLREDIRAKPARRMSAGPRFSIACSAPAAWAMIPWS